MKKWRSTTLCLSGYFVLTYFNLNPVAFAAPDVTIDSGKLVMHGTSAWMSHNKNDPYFPWGSDGKATYVDSLNRQKTLVVNVSGDSSTPRYVLLGRWDTGISTDGQVSLNLAGNSVLTASVFAVRNDNLDANSGIVSISGESGAVVSTEMVVGGLGGLGSDLKLSACGNIVSISGLITFKGTNGDTIISGAQAAKVQNNRLTVDSAIFDLKDTSESSKIFGGQGTEYADSNNLIIKDSGKISADFLVGGYATNISTRNEVNIINSTVETTVVGGQSKNKIVSENTVNLSNSKIAGNVYGGLSVRGLANSNVVEIHEGTAVTGNLYGGYSGVGDANSNTVKIFSSASLSGSVYGGFSENGAASSNKIHISGSPENINLSKVALYGGNRGTDNSLEIERWSGVVEGIDNFNRISITDVAWRNGNAVILADFVQDLSATDVMVKMHNVDGSMVFDTAIPKGNYPTFMYLIRPKDITASPDYKITQRGWVQSQTLLKKRAGVITAGNVALLVVEPQPVMPDPVPPEGANPRPPEVTNPIPPEVINPLPPIDEIFPGTSGNRPNEQVHILNDSREASLSFVNQGNDHMLSVLDSFSLHDSEGIQTFLSSYGQISKYKGNDSLRIKSVSVIAGLGDHCQIDFGSIQWGAFAEFGFGSYKTHNSFRHTELKGSGHIKYSGLGFLVRWHAQTGPYLEGAIRGGKLKTTLKNGIIDTDNSALSYGSGSFYFSGVLGAGYRRKVEDNTFTAGTRYIYGVFEADDLNIGDNSYHFASVDSHRVQLNLSIRHDFSEKLIGRATLTAEREFAGYTKNSVDKIRSDGQGLRGNTGALSVALLNKATKNFSIETRVRGSIGKCEGISAKIQANYYW